MARLTRSALTVLEMANAYFWGALVKTGHPFLPLVASVVRMGDGTGNETKMVHELLWSAVLGAVIWVLVALLSLWMWKHFSLTLK